MPAAIVVTPQWDEMELSSKDGTFKYLVYKCDDIDVGGLLPLAPADAIAAVAAFADPSITVNGFVQFLENVGPLKRLTEFIFECQTSYTRPDFGTTGTTGYTFEIGGAATKVQQSKETIGSYAISGTAPDFRRAIGVTKDEVQGVDLELPTYDWSESRVFDAADITTSYIDALYNLRLSPVNNDTFRDKAAGEVLFKGASGTKRSDADTVEINFKFSASPNKTDLTVGDMTGIVKGGWHYLWVLYQEKEDATAKRVVKRPFAVYVERVYDSGDFSVLGI